jgi:hypothetical protein
MPDKNYYPDALSKRIAQMFDFTIGQTEQKTKKSLLARLKARPLTTTIKQLPNIQREQWNR